MKNRVYYGDNLPILKTLSDASVNLIYIDPPFNTGKTQSRESIKVNASKDGDRVGLQGRQRVREGPVIA
ncbi:MAG: hypothetical protein AAB502_02360, partial [Chloroflexota bacterium]